TPDGPYFMFTSSKHREIVAWKVVQYIITGYYVVATTIQLALNFASLVLYNEHKKLTKTITISNSVNYEKSLVASMICNLIFAALFTTRQVFIQFFPLTPMADLARS
ncbi:hypothetical protein PMAYCL1PPCAC_31319, partial [Pristionchus mayeri]